MQDRKVVQVVKWHKTQLWRYELELAKRLFWHFFMFMIFYTIVIVTAVVSMRP